MNPHATNPRRPTATRRPLGPSTPASAAAITVLAGLLLGGCQSDANKGPGPGADRGGGGGNPLAGGRSEDLTLSGEAALARGDRERAIEQFARAIEINPRFVRAHLGMADVYRLAGDYNRAETSYRTAAELEPKSFDAQYGHGLMLHVLDRLSEAVGAYLRALQIRPADYTANLNLATAYYQLGEYRQAAPFAEAAARARPADGNARFTLGTVYAALRRDAEAVTEYQQAAESIDSPKLLLNMAESLGRLERWAEMRNVLEQVIKRQPSPAAYERLGLALFRQREYDAAKQAFESSLALDKDYFPALNGLGVSELRAWKASGDRDQQAKERGLAHLRRSLLLQRNQPAVEDLLTRFR